MIDFDGYRPNVGIIICNQQGQVLWAKRCGQNSWQFPQGGINAGETPEQAMYRELYEEVGLSRQDVKILTMSKGWLRYKLPKRLVRNDSNPVCIGQKQRWFLLKLIGDEKNINMQATPTPEFDGWRWVSYWYPVRQVISFKREVYRKVMKEFAPIALFQGQSVQANRASAVGYHKARDPVKNEYERERHYSDRSDRNMADRNATDRNPNDRNQGERSPHNARHKKNSRYPRKENERRSDYKKNVPARGEKR